MADVTATIERPEYIVEVDDTKDVVASVHALVLVGSSGTGGDVTTLPFSSITGTPTTRAGYGITDAASSAQGALAATAVQPAVLTAGLDTKANVADGITSDERTKLAGVAAGATANATNAQLRDRATHTGTQAVATVDGLQTALDGKAALADGISGAERTKLAGIATAATANATDAALRARASHTGSQLASTISDFASAVAADATVAALVARTPVVVLTQSAYDALTPPNAGTLYVVIG